MVNQSRLPKDLLPHAKASELVKMYRKDLGAVKLKLSELAIGEINRGISWKYVQTFLHRMFWEDGFSPERYKYAIAAEPKADDPLGSTRRHIQEATASAGMLPMIDERSRPGLFTKNHLFLALLCLKDGRIPKDSGSGESWSIPRDDGSGRHKALLDVLEHGMSVVLLDSAIWEHESLDDIKLIGAVDNMLLNL